MLMMLSLPVFSIISLPTTQHYVFAYPVALTSHHSFLHIFPANQPHRSVISAHCFDSGESFVMLFASHQRLLQGLALYELIDYTEKHHHFDTSPVLMALEVFSLLFVCLLFLNQALFFFLSESTHHIQQIEHHI